MAAGVAEAAKAAAVLDTQAVRSELERTHAELAKVLAASAALAAASVATHAAEVAEMAESALKRPRGAEPAPEPVVAAAAPTEVELLAMPWQNVAVVLCANAARAGAEVLAELTVRVVVTRAAGQEDADAAVAAGILPALAAVMHAHKANASVQYQACSALRKITAGSDAQRYARRQAASDAGALLRIVAVMHSQPNAAVQAEACGALCNITAGIGAERDMRAQAAAEAGALNRVVAVLAAPWASAAGQEQACGALINICAGADALGPARKQAAMEAGALSLCEALCKNSTNENVRKQAGFAYRNLSGKACV